MSTTAVGLSGPAERESIEAAVASGSSGYSRRMSLTFPVSTYFAFSFGRVSSWNAAQCEQVIEAYSTIVTGASGDPCTTSGKGPGAINWSTGNVVCASAAPAPSASTRPRRQTAKARRGRRGAGEDGLDFTVAPRHGRRRRGFADPPRKKASPHQEGRRRPG